MRRYLSIVFLLVAMSAALVVACGDDNSDAESHEAAVDVGAMLASLDILGSAGLHHMEMTLTVEGGGIEPAWLGSLRNARTAVAVVDWPEPLHELAEAFLAQSMLFEMALAADDASQAAETVTPAHGAFHALSGAGFAFLAEQAGMSAADHDDDNDHD